ncbi:MAG: hypothetical protein J7K04_12520 [Spirochaetales bacterium]|nr:hypothetical protein [Spirochaetales bacterium]
MRIYHIYVSICVSIKEPEEIIILLLVILLVIRQRNRFAVYEEAIFSFIKKQVTTARLIIIGQQAEYKAPGVQPRDRPEPPASPNISNQKLL